MNPSSILTKAKELQDELLSTRHYLHTHPGVGFDVKETYHYVKNRLQQMGYTPIRYGRSGLIATIGAKNAANTFLLRADMDALALDEGKLKHACGHDMHTTMLLGAARLLKTYEKELKGQVILLFQPAEEILQGAKDMIDAGVLADTKADAALMIHVVLGLPLDTGSVVVCDGGVSAPAADYFTIDIRGKGCHGSTPHMGIDPITTGAHIVTALQEISARELGIMENAIITLGTFQSGQSANVIPDTAQLKGTMRCFREDTRNYLKQRIQEMVRDVATVFRAEAQLKYTSGCPTLYNDSALSEQVLSFMKELLGEDGAFSTQELAKESNKKSSKTAGGSEDFAYFSHCIPSIMLSIATGSPKEGYTYPLHHPKVEFDESILPIGSAVYAYSALRWLEAQTTEA